MVTMTLACPSSIRPPPPSRKQMTPEHWRKGTRLVLLGGGVGINPLVSILRHVGAWLDATQGQDRGGSGGGGGFRVSLVYSAATADVRTRVRARVYVCMCVNVQKKGNTTGHRRARAPQFPQNTRRQQQQQQQQQELLFRREMEALAQQHPGVVDAPQFVCTRDPAWPGRTRRIDPTLLWSLATADGAWFVVAVLSTWIPHRIIAFDQPHMHMHLRTPTQQPPTARLSMSAAPRK